MLLSVPAWGTENGDAERLKIQIGGFSQTTSDEVKNIGGVDYLPLREILECFGMQISWANEADQKIIVTTSAQEKYELIISPQTQEVLLEDQAHKYKLIDQVVYLPLDFYLDVFNCSIAYDPLENFLLIDETMPPADTAAEDWDNYCELRNIPVYQKTEKQVKVAETTYTYYQEGYASWYGSAFQNRRTASGEAFDCNKLTAAHRTLPFGTKVRVTALHNGQSVIVTINDRGPHINNRIIDLSQAAARQIGLESKGVGLVKLEIVK